MLSRAKTRKNLKIIDFDPKAIIVNKDSVAEIKRMETKCSFSHKMPLNTLPGDYIMAIGHLNIRSLSLHYKDLNIYTDRCPVDILCVTETHINDYERYNLPGFTVFSAHKHGCAIYTTKPVCHHFSYCRNIETTAVVIDSLLTVCVYVPPNTSWAEIQNFFTEMLTECTSEIIQQYKCHTITFIGDFNTGHDSSLQKLTELFDQFGLHQHISTPTHSMGGTLDLIFTTHENVQTVQHPIYFTDHHFIAARFYPT
jgi:hypothetical protein